MQAREGYYLLFSCCCLIEHIKFRFECGEHVSLFFFFFEFFFYDADAGAAAATVSRLVRRAFCPIYFEKNAIEPWALAKFRNKKRVSTLHSVIRIRINNEYTRHSSFNKAASDEFFFFRREDNQRNGNRYETGLFTAVSSSVEPPGRAAFVFFVCLLFVCVCVRVWVRGGFVHFWTAVNTNHEREKERR